MFTVKSVVQLQHLIWERSSINFFETVSVLRSCMRKFQIRSNLLCSWTQTETHSYLLNMYSSLKVCIDTFDSRGTFFVNILHLMTNTTNT